MKTNIKTATSGTGPNTDESRDVIISEVKMGFNSSDLYPEEPFSGELRAYFDPSGFTHGSWNVSGFGLILGDKQWIKDFKQGMRDLGFSIKATQNIKYGETEMQKENYVSLTVGPTFYTGWKRLNR